MINFRHAPSYTIITRAVKVSYWIPLYFNSNWGVKHARFRPLFSNFPHGTVATKWPREIVNFSGMDSIESRIAISYIVTTQVS